VGKEEEKKKKKKKKKKSSACRGVGSAAGLQLRVRFVPMGCFFFLKGPSLLLRSVCALQKKHGMRSKAPFCGQVRTRQVAVLAVSRPLLSSPRQAHAPGAVAWPVALHSGASAAAAQHLSAL
jgi:hypothetical protein